MDDEEPIDLSQVLADESLIAALAAGSAGEDELGMMLAAWRDDVQRRQGEALTQARERRRQRVRRLISIFMIVYMIGVLVLLLVACPAPSGSSPDHEHAHALTKERHDPQRQQDLHLR